MRKLLMNAVLLFTAACALATILIPNTSLFSRIFWIGSTILFTFILPLSSRKYLKERSRRGYVFLKKSHEYEHRHIAKKTLNRNLLANEVVHHINGKPYDNRLENLCVMDRHQHELFHAWLSWKKKKNGFYPKFSEQKKLLIENHGGILLENVSTSPIPLKKRSLA